MSAILHASSISRGQRALRVLKILWIPALLFALLYLFFPKIFTGDFADVTVADISTTPDGRVTLHLESMASSGTPVKVQLYKNHKYVGGASAGAAVRMFDRRPSRSDSTFSFDLNPEKIAATGRFEDSPLYQRLLVRKGKTYHIQGDQVLKLFDFKTADGSEYTGFIRVNASLSVI